MIPSHSRSQRRATLTTEIGRTVDAVLFDVFGTTVDWLSSMSAHAARLGAERGIKVDWPALMREWRAHYKPAIGAVRDGLRPWAGFDVLHREELDKIVEGTSAARLSDSDRDRLTHGWHSLDAWPDAAAALDRLGSYFITGPLSNGSVRQLVDISDGAGLSWSVVFGADVFQTYKPAPALYLGACRLLGLSPKRVLLVAAHNDDLEHAASHGMRTCFVRRPTEDAEPMRGVDLVVDDFSHLVRALGIE